MVLPSLSTGRLWLRAMALGDAVALHEAYSDPECMRWWHRPPTTSLDETRALVAEMVEHEAQWSFGVHGSDGVLGHVGFVEPVERGGHAGFGYALRRRDWGRGLVPEAARVALDHGFGTAGLARVELWIDRNNHRSIRVAEKVGCVRRGEAHLGYERGPTPSVIYGVTAEAWRGDPEPPPTHFGVEPILAVSDVERAAEWWCSALGARVGFLYGSPPTHAGIRLDPGWTGQPGVQLSLRGDGSAGGASVFVFARDVDTVAARAMAAGAAVVTELGDRPWGMREIELRDPDGNRVRVGAPSQPRT